MKKAIFLSLLISGAVFGGWLYQDNETAPRIDDWIAQTRSLFNDAALSLEKMPISDDLSSKQDSLDEKLQALLPNASMDLSYSPASDNQTLASQALASKANKELLPNLFQSKNDKSTSLSGQVHMDEDDNIIGAEVQVSIPTHL